MPERKAGEADQLPVVELRRLYKTNRLLLYYVGDLLPVVLSDLPHPTRLMLLHRRLSRFLDVMRSETARQILHCLYVCGILHQSLLVRLCRTHLNNVQYMLRRLADLNLVQHASLTDSDVQNLVMFMKRGRPTFHAGSALFFRLTPGGRALLGRHLLREFTPLLDPDFLRRVGNWRQHALLSNRRLRYLLRNSATRIS